LLTHRCVLIRALSSWFFGLILFFAVWTVAYHLLPEGALRGRLPGARIPLDPDDGLLFALRIFAVNLGLSGGIVAFASLFRVGRLPPGYLVPWLLFAVYGALLGTNSFAYLDPAGPPAPTADVLWTRSGTRELTAYLLVAAALARSAFPALGRHRQGFPDRGWDARMTYPGLAGFRARGRSRSHSSPRAPRFGSPSGR
jgi:hypothetical protein